MKENKIYDNSKFNELLDNFLRGNMSVEEELEFKNLLKENTELKQKAVATVRLAKAMRQVGSDSDEKVVEEIKGTNATGIINLANKTTGRKVTPFLTFRRAFITLSAAASILLCIFGGYTYYKKEQVTSLGLEYLSYYPSSEFSRGENNDIENKLKELYSHIENRKHLDATIEDLERMWNESQSDTFNNYTNYMSNIGWMLANAYLCNNNKFKAISVLNTFIKEFPEGNIMRDKACELREKIMRI